MLIWIPSHSGVKGNVIADSLAKLAAKEKYTDSEPMVDVTDSEIRDLLQKKTMNDHNKY